MDRAVIRPPLAAADMSAAVRPRSRLARPVAVTKITAEIFALGNFAPAHASQFAAAIDRCRPKKLRQSRRLRLRPDLQHLYLPGRQNPAAIPPAAYHPRAGVTKNNMRLYRARQSDYEACAFKESAVPDCRTARCREACMRLLAHLRAPAPSPSRVRKSRKAVSRWDRVRTIVSVSAKSFPLVPR